MKALQDEIGAVFEFVELQHSAFAQILFSFYNFKAYIMCNYNILNGYTTDFFKTFQNPAQRDGKAGI